MAQTKTSLGNSTAFGARTSSEAHLEPKRPSEIAYLNYSSCPSLKEMADNERLVKKDQQVKYKEMLDEQIRMSHFIQK